MATVHARRYTTVIGLEIHAELLTKTKLFCNCPNTFGGGVNENVCPGCLGLPGTLPALNRAAVELAIKGGFALGCEIAKLTSWDRKNYFYADLPNGYQITQMFAPICIGGGVYIGGEDDKNSGRYIRLDHIHLEEDAGKLIHDNFRNTTVMDFNRAGVPLIEIVTKPDMRSAEEAAEFLEKVRLALIYAGVCDGRLEQGRMRVDANISVMPEGSDVLGTRVEIKNLNSFRFLTLAIGREAQRQIDVLESGGTLRQETRRLADENGATAAMREKEQAHDYRYFPDSDIPPLMLDEAYIEALRASMPEPPAIRRARYINAHHMSESDADVILARKAVSDFYDAAVGLIEGRQCTNGQGAGVQGAGKQSTVIQGAGGQGTGKQGAGNQGINPADVLGIVRGEILRRIGERDDGSVGVSPEDAARLLRMNAAGEISANNMKKAIGILMRDGAPPLDDVIKDNNMLIREDRDALVSVVRAALAANPAAVASYKAGEEKVVGYFMGQCNKTLKGSVQPKALQDEIKAQLEGTT